MKATDAPPELLATPLADDPMGVTIHRLESGLTVYVSPHRAEPRVHAWIAIRAGSGDDPANSTGLAHYLEHMMFKGSRRLGTLAYDAERPHLERVAQLYDALRGAHDPKDRDAILAEIDAATVRSAAFAIPNEIDRVYAALGILDVNAFTSSDETVYTADVPTDRFAAWAKLEGDRLAAPVFRLFFPELESVYEEKNMSLDDPHERVYEAMMAGLFPGHAYGTQPTLGLIEHLKTPAYADMVAFWQRHYRPNNAAIVLAGDVDVDAILPVLEDSFKEWRPAAAARSPITEAPRPAARVTTRVPAEGQQSVSLAWRTVPVGHDDEMALRILDRLVDNGTCGLLDISLRLSQVVPDAYAMSEFRLAGGYWGMTATARKGQSPAQLEALLRGIVERVKDGDFDEADLAAVRLHAKIHDQRALESSESRAARMSEAFTSRQSWPRYARRPARIAAVTRDDVIRVARAYLDDACVAVHRVHGRHTPPQIAKPRITPVDIDPDRESALAREIRGMPRRPPPPAWLRAGVDYDAREGPAGTVIAAPNRLGELFALVLVFTRGVREAPLTRLALELFERTGAGDLDVAALQRRLYALGTTVDTWCDADRMTVSMTGVDENMAPSLALLETWLTRPRLPAGAIEALVANRLSRRADELDEPETLAHAIAEYARLGDEAWWRLQPDNAGLAGLAAAPLCELLGELPRLARTALYFGPRSVDDAALTLGRDHVPLPRPTPVPLRRVARDTIFFTHKDMAQAQVQVFLPRPPLATAAAPLARLFDQYMGADMSGAIFQELREARGLAYAATARIEPGRRADDPAAVRGVVATQADKVVEALALLLDLIRGRGLLPARVDAARESLLAELRTTRVAPRAIARRVYEWRERGELEDPRPAMLAEIPKISADALAAFVEEHARTPASISLLGDRSRLDLAALARRYDVIEVARADLFSYGPFPQELGGAA